ncbi:MAG: tetratricopeptide repeat protein [Desulfobacteraceae bacterium]|nr:tetratricopeptide repeat protein [Desulfobacteraceae bacterium]
MRLCAFFTAPWRRALKSRWVAASGALALALLLTAAAGSQALAAGGTIQLSADDQFGFAREAAEKGAYTQAVFEFRRFVYFFPDDPRAGEARMAIGRALFMDRQFREAISAFREVVEKEGGRLAETALLEISAAHLALGETRAALQALDELLAVTADDDMRDRVWLRVGWIYLDQGEFDAARQAFARVRPESREKLGIGEIEEGLDRAGDISRKSPAAAGIFSLVPGGGYLYTGLKRDALVALLVNGAFAAAAWEAFDNDLPVLGGLLTTVGLGFYAGNIYGGVSSAHKFNRQQEKAFVERLRQDSRLRLGASPGGRGGWLALDIPF